MIIKDVIDVAKSGISQLIAKNYMSAETPELTETNTAALVDLGKTFEQNTKAADIFLEAIIDKCGRMIIDSRKYVAELPSLFVDPVEWGGFVEMVVVGLSDIMTDEMYPINGFLNYSATGGRAEAERIAGIEHGTYKPDVTTRYYNESHPVMVALSTIRDQLFTAVRGLDELNRLLSALYESVDNTLALKAELFALATVSMGAARAIGLGNVVHLVTEYNAEYDDDVTSANAMTSESFMAFALETIANTRDFFKRFAAVYNNHNHVTFTKNANLALLGRFANRAKFGVRANTFNEGLLGIGDFDKVTGWQAISTNSKPFSFGALSSISLTKSAAEKAGITVPAGETGVTYSGIIGVMYDRYAMGVTLDKKKVTTSYTAAQDKWNNFHHTIINNTINDDFPMVVFMLD